MNFLRQFWQAVTKVFSLPHRLAGVPDHRVDPDIPPPVLTSALFLGALLRVPSFLQLEQETGRRGIQRLLQWSRRISDDALAYGTAHADLGALRAVLVAVNRTLKANKAFESAKINGLLIVAIDAHEQFKSRARCCAECSQRQIQLTDAHGQAVEVTEYFHRHEGPFIRPVQKLGWGVITVLKQERFEVYQESRALTQNQPPLHWKWEDRQVDLWEVQDLPFTEVHGPVRVVVAQESWSEVKVLGGKRRVQAQHACWRWLVSEEFDGYGPPVVWQIGHRRWGVENHAFNELTQYYPLEHCPHHEPVAIVAWLLILVLAFVVFEWFTRVHGKLWRQGRVTLQELAKRLDRAAERWEELEPLWSG